MQKVHVLVIDPATGQARVGANVTVFLTGTSSLATLYNDAESATISNPQTTDGAGRVAFKVADGEYDIQVSGTGITTYKLTVVQVADKDSFALAGHTHSDVAFLTLENTWTKAQHWARGADIASAATLVLGTDGNYFHVTGSTTITAITSRPAGSLLVLEFDSTPTVIHNATSLILAGGSDFAAEAGSVLFLVSEGAGNWREVARKGGAAGAFTIGLHYALPVLVPVA
jgi:hypothetical protein